MIDSRKFNFFSSPLATTLTLNPIPTPQEVAMPLIYPPIIYYDIKKPPSTFLLGNKGLPPQPQTQT